MRFFSRCSCDMNAERLSFPSPLVGRVGERERAGVGVFNTASSMRDTFGMVVTPTRPSLRDGHPPHALAGEGEESVSVHRYSKLGSSTATVSPTPMVPPVTTSA